MRVPSTFVAHGAPMLLDDPVWVAELRDWAEALPRPRAVLVVSAHWESAPPTLGATRTVPLIHDFYGLPERYYAQRYSAPGAPALAERVAALIPGVQRTDRGLDHGAYVPLVAMYPDADVPVLQLSLPGLDPHRLVDMGRRLAPLRDEGVLIQGSGLLTHNLRFFSGQAGPPPEWAVAFDRWVQDHVDDVDALAHFLERAPHARLAHPRTEHFAPLLVAAGAAEGDPATFPITGWAWGPFTKRSVQYG